MVGRTKHHGLLVASLGVAVALTATACNSGSSNSASAAGPNAKIGTDVNSVCDLGQKEGALNIARGTDADVFMKEIAPFQAKYPGIKVHYTSLKPQDNAQRILAEAQTGHALDEDGTDYDLPTASALIGRGLIADVDWNSLGVPQDLQIKVGGVTVARTDLILLGLSYDKSKLDPSELPDTWDQLVDPKWADQVIVDPRGKYLAPLAVVWGEQKTVDWYKRLMATAKPVAVEGATSSLEKVVSGEAKLSASAHDAEVNELDASGANVGIKYLDVIPTDEDFVLIYKNAQHPNAIRCFYAWRLSDEGQAQIKKYEFKGDEVPSDLPPGSKLAANLTADQTALVTKVAGELVTLTQ